MCNLYSITTNQAAIIALFGSSIAMWLWHVTMDHQISQRRTSGFAVFTLVMATLFVELSVWQLQRRVETKATLRR
jgi:hypothetical protein